MLNILLVIVIIGGKKLQDVILDEIIGKFFFSLFGNYIIKISVVFFRIWISNFSFNDDI